MPTRKINMVEVKQDNISYEDVVESVTAPASIPEEETVPEIVEAPTPPLETIPAPEESEPVKAKKEVPMATCEGCGKTMTVKNLKYAHKFVCAKQEEPIETIAEEAEPPSPKKKLPKKKVKVTELTDVVEVVEVKNPKAPRKTKKVCMESAETSFGSGVSVFNPPQAPDSAAIKKAIKYTSLFESAMQ